jgi:glutamyl-Q tRNA(Asp) synthetase
MVALDLPSLARRLPSRPVTRFAPSPTGYLHLGHVANAAYVWGIAGALDGRVLLRLEDHDRIRCRPEYESALLEDLDWLGFAPDRGTTAEFRAGPSNFRQSDCEEVYRAALARLSEKAPVYACDCSRRDIAEDGGDAFSQETRYSGRCRDRGLPLAIGIGVRVQITPGPERFGDGLLGEQVQVPSEQCGDLLLRDRVGNWTYHFAVVVDDARQEIDLVIRGCDLLPSTGRQIQLARLLGRANPPLFVHHPLICKSGGVKLSKATGDTGIRELRRQGVPPSAVLGQAVYLTGLLPTPRELQPADLAGLVAAG